MKIDAIKFGLACAIALAIAWVVCSGFVMFTPESMMEISGNMIHMDLSTMGWDMGAHGLLVGMMAWALVGGLTGATVATIYNRLVGE